LFFLDCLVVVFLEDGDLLLNEVKRVGLLLKGLLGDLALGLKLGHQFAFGTYFLGDLAVGLHGKAPLAEGLHSRDLFTHNGWNEHVFVLFQEYVEVLHDLRRNVLLVVTNNVVLQESV
jgi:hypothetical protein